jgi:F-type H+-transporting ATPase subunit a
MSRIWILVAALMFWAAPAFSAPPSADQEEESVADYVLHHIADGPVWEIEVPLSYDHIYIPLPQIHVPLSAGACEPIADPDHPGQTMMPGLGAGCLDLSITKHTVIMWVAALLLVLVMLLVPNRKKEQLVQRGTWANIVEMMVLFVRDELAIKNIGPKHGPRYTPYLLTIFFFILFMNLLGQLPWSAVATSNLAVTAALALCTFVVTQVASIRVQGIGGYLKHLTGGVHPGLWIIMVPVEVLGLFTKPFALTVRLFANMVAGHIMIFFLLGLIFILKNAAVAVVSVPFAMGIFFLEFFVSFVQAFIFTMLSALFIGLGVEEHDHDADHHEGTGHAATH